MGGGGGVIGAIVGAVVTVIGIVTAQPELIVMGVSMMASAIISSTVPAPSTYNPNFSSQTATQLNTGTTIQLQPATNNKLPVVYGTAYVGGIVTDLSITSDNQNLYFVVSLCEVTGGGIDNISFGDIYYAGKKCVLSGTSVTGLIDPSTGITDTTCNGYLNIYLYKNGSFNPVNTSLTAVQVMQSAGLTYTWDSSKKMSNTAFAIIQLTYSQSANITSLAQTKFQITNARDSAGDVIYDYMTNKVYGAAIPTNQIDMTSITALNTYANQTITFTPYTGGSATQARFKFNGVIDNRSNALQTLQTIASCADCLIKYNEIYGIWSVIVQSPTYSVAININNSNTVGAITVTTMDISNVYNIAQCQFPDITQQSAFNTATVDLSIVAPSLLYPNEPTNSQTVVLPLVNNNVQAQLLATRFLKSARLDLQIKVTVNYIGLELEAGDIVSVTNANYGWTNMLFRVMQVNQNFQPDGAITVDLNLQEYDPAVFSDTSITQYTPPANTGLANPNVWSTLSAPTITNIQTIIADPSFAVNVTTPSAGVTQYAEIWYSAFSSPTSAQRIFAGTTAIQSNGTPYAVSTAMPAVTLTNIPSGNWYFFSRMVNSLGNSVFSPASALLQWRPVTTQYEKRYLIVAYADTITGGGFSANPTSKSYFGLLNLDTATFSTDPTAYTWYVAPIAFGTTNFFLYINYQNRKFAGSSGGAVYASSTGAYVPSDTANYDQSLWSALPAGTNTIDLDARTGQLLKVGTTSISAADGLLNVTNTPEGTVVAALERFLNFGAGVQYKTSAIANLTIDVYGRVVGFTAPDNFYYTETVFNTSAGQTIFALTHTVGNILVFKNGTLLDTSDYTETGTTITLGTACPVNTKVTVLNMRAATVDIYYEPLNISIASSTTNSITYSTSSSPYQNIVAGDKLCFINTGTPTTYTVSTVNPATRVITFTGTISGATTGLNVYRYRAAGATYTPFSRYSTTLTNASTYTPSQWALRSGFELVFVNGVAFNALDYNITAGGINGLPDLVNGNMTIIQFAENNLSVSCSACSNSLTSTISGTVDYAFANNIDAFELYSNGAMMAKGYDYTDTSTIYTLSTTPTNSYTLLQQQTFARVGAA